MRRFSQRLGERSIELSALADATTPLYASLDDKQKLVFDATLRGFLPPVLLAPAARAPGGSIVAADGGLTWRAAPSRAPFPRDRIGFVLAPVPTCP